MDNNVVIVGEGVISGLNGNGNKLNLKRKDYW